MKNLLLSIGILLSVVTFSQKVSMNVDNDIKSEYTSVDIFYVQNNKVIKMSFNNDIDKTSILYKFKIVGIDKYDEKYFILENKDLGIVRFTHDIVAFTGKIEIKDKRTLFLN